MKKLRYQKLVCIPCLRARVKAVSTGTLFYVQHNVNHVGIPGLSGDQWPGGTLRWDVELRAGPVEWGGLLGVLIIKE